MNSTTSKINTACGKSYITTVFKDDGDIKNLFTSMGKAGNCASSQCEAICRMVNLALSFGCPVEAIIKNLKGIMCHAADPNNGLHSCSHAIGRALKIAKK